MSDIFTLEKEGSDAAQNLPALLAAAESLATTFMAGAHGRKRPGAGETFWQYRDYTYHDPASAIDWRQSARSPNRLFIRESEWETAATIGLWCNGGPSFQYAQKGAPSKLWCGQVMTVAMALVLTRAGERIYDLNRCSRARGGYSAVLEVAESLLSAEYEELPPTPPAQNTHILYLSDFYTPLKGLATQLETMAATGIPCHLVQISDQTEEDFPFTGRTQFEGLHRNIKRYIFGNATDIRTDYLEQRQAHLGALKDLCRKYGFTYLQHRNDRSAAPILAALHYAIGGEALR
ncbi:MAG: DUF58 domain-containing protein [Pseudomonadota bacterium]